MRAVQPVGPAQTFFKVDSSPGFGCQTMVFMGLGMRKGWQSIKIQIEPKLL